MRSGHTARVLSGWPGVRRVAERFSFSKSTRREVDGSWVGKGDAVSVMGERTTLPRVKPEPTFRVTEVTFPVNRRMPRSDLRRARMGSSLREREMAMERPIVHARKTLSFMVGKESRELVTVGKAVPW